jgi:hypothetical protein
MSHTTPGERAAVVELLDEGFSYREIAKELWDDPNMRGRVQRIAQEARRRELEPLRVDLDKHRELLERAMRGEDVSFRQLLD